MQDIQKTNRTIKMFQFVIKTGLKFTICYYNLYLLRIALHFPED